MKLFGINENTFGLPDFAGPDSGLVPGWTSACGPHARRLARARWRSPRRGLHGQPDGCAAYAGRRPAASGPARIGGAAARGATGAGAPPRGQPRPSAGCGKSPTQALGAIQGAAADGRVRRRATRATASTTCACRANYDPSSAYRTVYLGPGCGPPQDRGSDRSRRTRWRPRRTTDAILIAMEPGLYNKAEYNSADVHPRRPTRRRSNLCHYCFDDGAATTTPDSVEYALLRSAAQADRERLLRRHDPAVLRRLFQRRLDGASAWLPVPRRAARAGQRHRRPAARRSATASRPASTTRSPRS